jgi:hypothetical protein
LTRMAYPQLINNTKRELSLYIKDTSNATKKQPAFTFLREKYIIFSS